MNQAENIARISRRLDAQFSDNAWGPTPFRTTPALDYQDTFTPMVAVRDGSPQGESMAEAYHPPFRYSGD